MKSFLKDHWRETLGWMLIIGFGWYYLYYYDYGILADRKYGFDFFVVLLALLLVWLRVNRK